MLQPTVRAQEPANRCTLPRALISFMRSHAATAAVLEPGPPEGNAAVSCLRGRLDAYSIGSASGMRRCAALDAHAAQPVIIDAAGVEYCDGAGIALLVELLRRPRTAKRTSVRCAILHERFERLLNQFDPQRFTPEARVCANRMPR